MYLHCYLLWELFTTVTFNLVKSGRDDDFNAKKKANAHNRVAHTVKVLHCNIALVYNGDILPQIKWVIYISCQKIPQP